MEKQNVKKINNPNKLLRTKKKESQSCAKKNSKK